MVSETHTQRVLSGMRPTGALHIGHYHGVIKNWLQLQNLHECFFFVADWHALTTHYADSSSITEQTTEMVIDWLACGLNPGSAVLFVQSQVPAHAELHLLLSMITPLGWLERVPSYKDMQERCKDKDLSTYGFLGYPLLQSADILIYRATGVPVGEDQVSHVELTREIARRFNHLFGDEPDFKKKVKAAIKKLGSKQSKLYLRLRKQCQENCKEEDFEVAKALLNAQQNISISDRERLFGYLKGSGRILFPEPKAMLTPAPKLLGSNGQKMSKSFNNTIAVREPAASIERKINKMPTDPARIKRSDAGDPSACPVYSLHQVYSQKPVLDWVQNGCRSATIGCLDCKRPLIDSIQKEVEPIRTRAEEISADKSMVHDILAEGNETARTVSEQTLHMARAAMRLDYE